MYMLTMVELKLIYTTLDHPQCYKYNIIIPAQQTVPNFAINPTLHHGQPDNQSIIICMICIINRDNLTGSPPVT